jgi:putative transposase
MGHNWTEIYVHLVWSTKTREPQILPAWEERLHAFMAGVAKDLGAEPYEINGMSDHVHLLLRCPTDRSIATLVRDLKARSSKWAHQSVKGGDVFDWQDGYGAFTISKSSVKSVRAYIRGQKEHHARMTFDEEWKMFIERMRGFEA